MFVWRAKKKQFLLSCFYMQRVMWCNFAVVQPQQPAAKQTCEEEESTGEWREIQLMPPSLSAVCLHHTGPEGTSPASLLLSYLSLCTLLQTCSCSKFRPVPLPFRSAALLSIRGNCCGGAMAKQMVICIWSGRDTGCFQKAEYLPFEAFHLENGLFLTWCHFNHSPSLCL